MQHYVQQFIPGLTGVFHRRNDGILECSDLHLVDVATRAASSAASSPLVKDIIVARAGRNFRNGNQAFDLTTQNIDEIVRNFTLLGKQVPLILAAEHLFGQKRSAVPASGWIESMYRDGNDWHAVVKFVGEAAALVANDQFRGVSIGTIMARDVHGQVVGEALDHLLLTNAPFFPLNIAATGEGVAEGAEGSAGVRYLTSQAVDMSPLQTAQMKYMQAIAADDTIAASEATEEIVRLTRSAQINLRRDPFPSNGVTFDKNKFHHMEPESGDPRFNEFSTVKCAKCGTEFETRDPNVRKHCAECLTKPRS